MPSKWVLLLRGLRALRGSEPFFYHREHGAASARDQNLRGRTRFGQVVVRIRRARLSLFIRALRAIRCFYVLMWSGLASCPLNYLETSLSCCGLVAQVSNRLPPFPKPRERRSPKAAGRGLSLTLDPCLSPTTDYRLPTTDYRIIAANRANMEADLSPQRTERGVEDIAQTRLRREPVGWSGS